MSEKGLLRDNVKKLRQLNEWVSRNDVIDAINNRDIIFIYYDGDKTINRGYRTIEPYAVGTHKSTGNLVLRAWQQAGASDSNKSLNRRPIKDEIPGWRLFRLDGITSFMKTFKNFPAKNKEYRGAGASIGSINGKNEPAYNPDDRDMATIFAAVDPDVDPKTNKDSFSTIKNPNVSKEKISGFDKQAHGLKSFFKVGDSSEEGINKQISDIYGYIKTAQKKDPMNYIIVDRGDGMLWYDLEKNRKKYKEEDIKGNLLRKYRELNNIGLGKKSTTSFFRKSREEFLKNLRK